MAGYRNCIAQSYVYFIDRYGNLANYFNSMASFFGSDPAKEAIERDPAENG